MKKNECVECPVTKMLQDIIQMKEKIIALQEKKLLQYEAKTMPCRMNNPDFVLILN